MRKSQARDLATRALDAAMAEDWPVASRTLNEIGADPKAITYALVAWCDTTIAAQEALTGQPLPDTGQAVAPGWWDREAGRLITNADAIPPEGRWAGRLLAARASRDTVMFQTLIGTMPRDGWKRGDYAAALLQGCAGIVKLAHAAGGAS